MEVMQKYIEFGKAFGYDFKGCKEDMARMIERKGQKISFK